MSPEAVILMIVKLVFHLAILGWLPNLHMKLPDAENTCSAACNQIMISTCGTKLFVPKLLCVWWFSSRNNVLLMVLMG